MYKVSTVLSSVGVYDSLGSYLTGYRKAKEFLSDYLGDTLDKYGLDPWYSVTVIANLVFISYWKDIKNWKKQAIWVKMLVVNTGLFALMLNMFSLFRLFGLVDL